MPVRYWESMTQFLNDLPPVDKRKESTKASVWTGNESYQHSKDCVFKGWPEAVPNAEKLMERIETAVTDTESDIWEIDAAGPLPNMPSWIVDDGDPECMLLPNTDYSSTEPVRVFASCVVSSGISAADLERRGAGILALVLKLSKIRTVDLYVMMDGGSPDNDRCAIPIVKIESRPIDMASASYALSSAGFSRHLLFEAGYSFLGFNGSWAWNENPRSESYQTKLAATIGATEEDIVIPGGHLSDPLIKDPVKWVNMQLERYKS